MNFLKVVDVSSKSQDSVVVKWSKDNFYNNKKIKRAKKQPTTSAVSLQAEIKFSQHLSLNRYLQCRRETAVWSGKSLVFIRIHSVLDQLCGSRICQLTGKQFVYTHRKGTRHTFLSSSRLETIIIGYLHDLYFYCWIWNVPNFLTIILFHLKIDIHGYALNGLNWGLHDVMAGW